MTDNRERADSVAALLSDLEPAATIERLVRTVASARPVFANRRRDYLSLRPSIDLPVATYVHRNRVSVALDPSEARDFGSRLTGSTLQRKTAATTYLVADVTAVEASLDATLAAVERALDWRTSGPNRGLTARGRRATRDAEPETCPDCWHVIAANGTCFWD